MGETFWAVWCSKMFTEKDETGNLRYFDCKREHMHSGPCDSPLAQETRKKRLAQERD